MKVVAFLPVKGTSERVPNKNTKLLDGKPLFMHSLEKLVRSRLIDEVYLDTESAVIAEMASHLDCQWLKRSPKLATNRTDGHKLFSNEVEHVVADIYVQLLGTSPFILEETIARAVETLKHGSRYDSVVLVRREKQYTWDADTNRPHYPLEAIPNSSDLPATVIETMGLYVVRRDAALATRRRIGNAPLLLEATATEAVDVNWEDDFELASLIQAGLRQKRRRHFECLRLQLTSPLLSDIMDDLGLEKQIITSLNISLKGQRVLGRAATLKLRERRPEDDPKGIYDALRSYREVVDDDIIVVENEVSEFAYFGELNANLAIRAGAKGVVVGGKTRDSDAVARLGIPVFSRGSTCQDVKGRAVLESIQKPVEIDGVRVNPGDLVFGDSEGVVVIPRALEEQVLEKVQRSLDKESGIVRDIVYGKDPEELLLCHGVF